MVDHAPSIWQHQQSFSRDDRDPYDMPSTIFAATWPNIASPTPLTQLFMARANVEWLVQQMEQSLSKSEGQPVHLVFSSELATAIATIASQNQMLASTQENLQALNQAVIAEEVKVQRLSLSHQRRQHRLFVLNDRLRVMPRPRQADEGAKWDGQTQHVVNHPASKHKAAFDAFVRQK